MVKDTNKIDNEELFEWLKDLKEKDPISFVACMGMLYGYATANKNINIIVDKPNELVKEEK